MRILSISFSFFFFFNDTATTEIYTLSLHDALPIFAARPAFGLELVLDHDLRRDARVVENQLDRKSTRLNSSHSQISYAVFCLKKKKNIPTTNTLRLSSHTQTLATNQIAHPSGNYRA